MKQLDWNDFPAVCLELIDEVESTGASIEIVRDGSPVLLLVPASQKDEALVTS